jgi:hypothetical protein
MRLEGLGDGDGLEALERTGGCRVRGAQQHLAPVVRVVICRDHELARGENGGGDRHAGRRLRACGEDPQHGHRDERHRCGRHAEREPPRVTR